MSRELGTNSPSHPIPLANDDTIALEGDCEENASIAESSVGSVNADYEESSSEDDVESLIRQPSENHDDNSDDDNSDDDNSDDDNLEDDNSDDDGKPTLKTIARWIKEGACSKILVLSGAGVSCSAGIPDFRSPGTGLYDNLQKYDLPFPEAVFDLDFFTRNPHPFLSLAKEIWPGGHAPTLTHSFLTLLDKKKLLLRNYTQNIDGLEILAGVSPKQLVECHGHFRTAACTSCDVRYDGGMCKQKIVYEETVPLCSRCGHQVKPDIVFFGESLPQRFTRLVRGDLATCDLLIVMGTSLTVAPVSMIPELVSESTPRVLFNKELVGDFLNCRERGFTDVFSDGECDESVRKLCQYLHWEEELEELNASTREKLLCDLPSDTSTSTNSSSNYETSDGTNEQDEHQLT